MKIKLGLFGGSGKMGKAVEQMIPLMKMNSTLVPFLSVGEEASVLFAISAAKIQNVEEDLLKDVDVWIDFTSEKGLFELLNATKKFNTPVVSGSTGFSEAEFSKIKVLAKKRPLFWSSNMSPGLWAFRQAIKGLASISNFDFSLEEIHHTQKKDKPSGTAKTLASDLEKILNKKIDTPISLRLGGIFGIHTLVAGSTNEMITMQHQALNRTVFAEGALMASEWIIKQKSGLYSMDDLFLKNNANEEKR